MPASVTSIAVRRRGTYVLLAAAVPQHAAQTIGVLLADPAADRMWLRIRQEFEDFGEEAELLQALEPDLRAKALEMGAEAMLRWLEDSFSNSLVITDRQAIEVDAFTRVLDRLYGEHVGAIEVKRYGTHVPLFSLRAAAGRLGEEMESTEEDWVRAPEGMHLEESLFAAHVVGRSMEPRIPDGSLNLFRFHPAGSRQNKVLLIQRFGVTDESARYTIKKYTSRKIQTGEDQWQHEQIRLEPLNPEFEAWDAGPEDFAVVAEWLRVIE